MQLDRTPENDLLQLWWINLDDPHWDGFLSVLSQEEITKATQFIGERPQQYYRRCRCALRMLLANQSQQNACSIEFEYNHFGKPELKNKCFNFNVSHSGNKALIGISSYPLGVDIEYISDSSSDIDDLIELTCHDAEKRMLNNLSKPERIRMFYRLWTQKESYCKALGIGLARDIRNLQFDSLPDSLANRSCLRVRDELHKVGPAYFVATSFQAPAYVMSVCSTRLGAILKVHPTTATPNYFGTFTNANKNG